MIKKEVLITKYSLITAHSWCDGYSTIISTCTVCVVRVGFQVSKKELHTHIYLD